MTMENRSNNGAVRFATTFESEKQNPLTELLKKVGPTSTPKTNPLYSNTSSTTGLSLTLGNLTSTASVANVNGSEIGAVVSKVWENVKKMMGFSPECQNGGHKNLRGDCICSEFYNGDYCENIICRNNGTPLVHHCRCPHPDFIYGKHCEIVRCHNGGRHLGNGNCACIDGWYTGQFCQYYTSSWLLAVGLPLLGIAIIIMCCVFCRVDICPSRRLPRRERRSRRYYFPRNQHDQQQQQQLHFQQQMQHERFHQQQSHPQLYVRDSGLSWRGGFHNGTQMALLNQELSPREQAAILQEIHRIEGVPYSHRQVSQNQYVVRLEQISDYNPRVRLPPEGTTTTAAATATATVINPVSGTAGSGFKIEPPPPYEEAVLRCPSLNLLPPDYSPPHSNINNNNNTNNNNNVVLDGDGVELLSTRQRRFSLSASSNTRNENQSESSR